LTSYLAIIKKNIGDSVPKAIMHFLVNYTKLNLQNTYRLHFSFSVDNPAHLFCISSCSLIESLYKEDKVEELLQEDKEAAAQRMNCKAMLDVLKKASAIINQVTDNEL